MNLEQQCMALINQWLFMVFIASWFMQFAYLLFIHLRFLRVKPKEISHTDSLPPLSVIVAARNESENLYELIPLILEQDYPSFEVIVVNNQSMDDSKWLLKAYQRQYPNLHVVELEQTPHLRPGKKLPLTLAVRAASFDHFVFTDADCRPTSKQWLTTMANGFSPTTDIVLGYGPYLHKKGFLNRLIRFDTAWIALNYFSFALSGLPYMGVGRNLAYSRKAFESVGGFKSHYYIVSGDDDLFIQQAAKHRNYTLAIEEESFCPSAPEVTWKRWVFQKRRHYSTSSHYDVIKKSLLGIYPVSLFFLLISFLSLLLTNTMVWLSLGLFFGLILIKWMVQGWGLFKLKEKRLAWFFPLWDFFYAIFIPLVFLLLNRKPRNKW
jgi:cellulose synthase/poly-beta-1,6-N-acetylglucosamine synthase-like glycosyltransferase